MNGSAELEDVLEFTKKGKFHWGRWLFAFLGLVVFAAGFLLLRAEFTVTGEGEVFYEGERILYAAQDNRVRDMFVEEGEFIAEGTALLQFDNREEKEAVGERRREVQQLEGRLILLRRAVERVGKTPEEAPFVLAEERRQLLSEMIEEREDRLARFANLAAQRAISSLQIGQEELALLRDQMELLEWSYLSSLIEEGYLADSREDLALQVEQLESELLLLKESLGRAEERLEETVLRSPMDGQVIHLGPREPGERWEAGQQLVRIADMENLPLVRAWVGERNIDLVRPGTPVRMESRVFDSPLEGYLHGVVRKVGRAPDREYAEEWGDRYFEVIVEVTETPHPLITGTGVRVEIVLGSRNFWQIISGQRGEER